jgi:hypothetical protein
MPHAIGPWGTGGAFGALLAATLVFSPLLLFMPAHPPASEDPVKPGLSLGPAVAAALLASLVVTVGLDALWAFAERIGRRSGLEPTALGLVLGLASLAVVAAAGSRRGSACAWGRGRPGPRFGAAVVRGVGHARSPGAPWPRSFPGPGSSQPFMMGAMAALPTGVSVDGAMTVGGALGPRRGPARRRRGYASLGWLGATCGPVSLALIGPVVPGDRVGLPRERSTLEDAFGEGCDHCEAWPVQRLPSIAIAWPVMKALVGGEEVEEGRYLLRLAHAAQGGEPAMWASTEPVGARHGRVDGIGHTQFTRTPRGASPGRRPRDADDAA